MIGDLGCFHLQEMSTARLSAVVAVARALWPTLTFPNFGKGKSLSVLESPGTVRGWPPLWLHAAAALRTTAAARAALASVAALYADIATPTPAQHPSMA